MAQLEREFPDKDNAGISSADINGLKVRNVIKKGSGSQRNSGATPLSPTASVVEFLQESSARKNLGKYEKIMGYFIFMFCCGCVLRKGERYARRIAGGFCLLEIRI